jgi:hypothetical protein
MRNRKNSVGSSSELDSKQQCQKPGFWQQPYYEILIPFFFIPERDLSLLFPFSQVLEKGLGDEGFNYLSR